MRLLLVLAALAAIGLGVARLAGDEPLRAPDAPPRAAEDRGQDRPAPRGRPLRRARCPAGAANCAAVTGRVLYVEAVDPDGDGDAHYVLAGGRVTAPGISVVDVSRDLRPRRLPRPGDLVSAAGPVFRGSYGQRQVQATEVHHRRRR